MTLDSNLAALLTETVSYEKATGLDKYGQPQHAAAVALLCYPVYGSKQIEKADGSVYVSTQSFYFDGSDATVQGFELGDRFTSIGIGGGQTLEAVAILTEYSPGPALNEPMTQWLVEVVL